MGKRKPLAVKIRVKTPNVVGDEVIIAVVDRMNHEQMRKLWEFEQFFNSLDSASEMKIEIL